MNVITFSSNAWKSRSILKLINDLEKAVQKRCGNPRAVIRYEEANDKANKMTEYIYLTLVKITIPSIFIIHFVASFFIYFTTDSGENSFRLPFPIEYPFNLKTPIGYSIAFSVTFAAFYIIGQSCTCILGLLIGLYSMITSYIQDFKEDLRYLAEDKRRICDFVKLHSQAKRFASEFAYIYEIIITGYYMWSVLTICDNLLSVQLEIVHNPESPIIWISLAKVFWSFAQIFFFCYFGEQLTAAFSELNIAIYECEWYSLSMKVQQILPTILANTQQPVYLEGFSNTRCTLQTFKGIANGGFSYFTLLRQMEN